MRQAGTEIDENADLRKYTVGRRLVFVRYAKGEIKPERSQKRFHRGDVLIVRRKNRGGFGIVVRRESDGHSDMVWPNEVRLLQSRSK